VVFKIKGVKMDDLTREEKQLEILMKIWAFLFGAGGLLFFIAPDWLFRRMNGFASSIFGNAFSQIPEPTERFWLSLALSLMVTLTFLSYMAQRDIRKGMGYVVAVMVSKIASTTFFLFYFFKDLDTFAYIQGSLLTDGPIFVITFIFYLRALGSRT